MKKIISIFAFIALAATSVFAIDVKDVKTTADVITFVKETPVVSAEEFATIKAAVKDYKYLSDAEFNKQMTVVMLGLGKTDAVYQEMFKAYVFDLAKTSNKEACQIIANELKVLVASVNEDDAAQVKWLNRLRLYYAVYSELY